jgi:hypothetical protein
MKPSVLTILGATGTIGVNTLDVVARHPGRFEIFALTGATQVERMFEQCRVHRPRVAVMSEPAAAAALREMIAAENLPVDVLEGAAALTAVATAPEVDTLMAAIVGAAGLPATFCQTPAELGRCCEVVFTIITSSADVEGVALGADGLIDGMAPGSVLVDCSTIAPDSARHIAARLAERGIHFLDAPVSGGAQGAIDATLAIMAGGEAAVLEKVRPLLECLGKRIVHISARMAPGRLPRPAIRSSWLAPSRRRLKRCAWQRLQALIRPRCGRRWRAVRPLRACST